MTDTSEDITISINGTSHRVLCGLCNQPITFLGKPDPNTGDAGCTDCGNAADVKEVARQAIEYAKDEGQLMLNRLAQKTASQSKMMSFKGQTEHDKPHRFVVDLKL